MTQLRAEGVEGGQHGGGGRGAWAHLRPRVQARRRRGENLQGVRARANGFEVPNSEVPTQYPMQGQAPGHEERHHEDHGIDLQAGPVMAKDRIATQVARHDRGANIRAQAPKLHQVQAVLADQAYRGTRVDVDILQAAIDAQGMDQVLLTPGRRLEAGQISRQQTHRHGSEGGRENRPERRHFLRRLTAGQGQIVSSQRRGADRRSRSVCKVRDAL